MCTRVGVHVISMRVGRSVHACFSHVFRNALEKLVYETHNDPEVWHKQAAGGWSLPLLEWLCGSLIRGITGERPQSKTFTMSELSLFVTLLLNRFRDRKHPLSF